MATLRKKQTATKHHTMNPRRLQVSPSVTVVDFNCKTAYHLWWDVLSQLHCEIALTHSCFICKTKMQMPLWGQVPFSISLLSPQWWISIHKSESDASSSEICKNLQKHSGRFSDPDELASFISSLFASPSGFSLCLLSASRMHLIRSNPTWKAW